MKHTLTRLCAALLALMLCLSCLGPVSFAADEGPYWGSSSDNGDGTFDNDACVDSDTPDPDIIRVGDAYYMTSTSMHFCPGVPIMKSYDGLLGHQPALSRIRQKILPLPHLQHHQQDLFLPHRRH